MEYKKISERERDGYVIVVIEDENGKQYEMSFARASRCDSSGNPRLIASFTKFLTNEEMKTYGIHTYGTLYQTAKKRAKKAGFSAYRGKDFNGGFVAQGWFPDRLLENIIEVLPKNEESK